MVQLPGFLIHLYEKIIKLSTRWISTFANYVWDNGPVTVPNELIESNVHETQTNAHPTLDNQQNMTSIQTQIDDLKSMFDQRIIEVERSVKSVKCEIKKISIPSSSSSGNIMTMKKGLLSIGNKVVQMNITK